jgi:hypothetical protein
MRVTVFVVSLLVMVSPSRASESCMTMSEAREHFVSAHIYWHGANHCWDTTPSRSRQAEGIRAKTSRQAPQETQEHNQEQNHERNQEPKWPDAMAAMLPADWPSARPHAAGPSQGDGENRDAVVVGANWLDRWVDVAQIVPQAVTMGRLKTAVASLNNENRAEPIVTLRGVILVSSFGLLLVLVAIESSLRTSSFNDESEA